MSVLCQPGCSQSICKMVGTAEKLVIASLEIVASTSPASNCCTGITVPPLNKVGNVTWFSPVTWNIGASANALSVESTSMCAS